MDNPHPNICSKIGTDRNNGQSLRTITIWVGFSWGRPLVYDRNIPKADFGEFIKFTKGITDYDP